MVRIRESRRTLTFVLHGGTNTHVVINLETKSSNPIDSDSIDTFVSVDRTLKCTETGEEDDIHNENKITSVNSYFSEMSQTVANDDIKCTLELASEVLPNTGKSVLNKFDIENILQKPDPDLRFQYTLQTAIETAGRLSRAKFVFICKQTLCLF